MNEVIEMLSYPFMQRAFVLGILVAVSAALLGVSLVLRRYSMIGDGLSHVGFGALAAATVTNAAPLAVAIPVVIAAAFLLLRISDKSSIKGDAATALISTGALALGVLIVSAGGGTNTDLYSYMFGSILAVSGADMVSGSIISAVIILVFVLIYQRVFAVTLDESFARASGTKAGLINAVVAVLCAVTIVLGMRLMGTMLISALIIFPPLGAMRVFDSFRGVTVFSAVLSAVCFAAGLFASYFLSLPAGASVVAAEIIAFLILCFAGALTSRFKKEG